MYIKKEQIPILAVNILALIIFCFIFLSRKNYEFLIYVGVIVFFLLVIVSSNRKINYPNGILWGLTIWSLLHMSGGGIYIGGQKLYATMMLPLIGEPYNILRYDQFVHFVGFWVATLVVYHLLKKSLTSKRHWISLSIVVVMAGLGLGALNEIVEFTATVILPETGVGGYVNTSLDLVSNLLGAIGAMIYIRLKEKYS